MESVRRYLVLISVGILWSCVLCLQRPPPRYSQQYMPETSFSCRNKIVGSYYADPETDCQVFHVCVSVAGTIQDYKFLCPNDTAFDQESQTCADWYDVDCEAATLYYASDNFDLYRIGSGLESVAYDSLRSDAEPQDHLQRSETSDAVRSSANTVNRVSSSNYNNNNRDILRGSSSGNFYNRNNKEDDYETEKSYKEDVSQDTKKKGGVRKVSRKQPYTGNGSANYTPSTTSTSAPAVVSQKNYNGNYYNTYNNQRQSTAYVSTSTTARPQENYNKNLNTQRYNTAPSTYRPSTTYQNTYNNYQSPSSTTARTTQYNTNVYNSAYNTNYNQQNTGNSASITTLRPSSYSPKTSYQAYQGQFAQSTTVQPSTNYQSSDYTNYQQRSYNNIQRGSSSVAYQSTTPASTVYDNNNYNNNNNNYNSNNNNYNSNNNNYNGNNHNYNNNNGQYRPATSTRQDVSQTTAKYFASNFASNSYAPTTYSPATKKYANGDNTVAQTALRNDNAGQYYDKTSQAVKPSTQYYDTTRPPKKATQYNNYDSASSGKSYYIESSTSSYDLGRSSVGIGFSPASINHLAESPRTTTPVPRRSSSATTYNPNTFSSNAQKTVQPTTTPRGVTYVSGSARPFTSTTRLPSSSSSTSNTTARPKSGKKNDYDYAYYDSTGALEYDGVDLEHVTSNKESTKIARN